MLIVRFDLSLGNAEGKVELGLGPNIMVTYYPSPNSGVNAFKISDLASTPHRSTVDSPKMTNVKMFMDIFHHYRCAIGDFILYHGHVHIVRYIMAS